MLIDPCPNPNKKMSIPELEAFILFSIAVAGKNAKYISKAIVNFLSFMPDKSPFKSVRKMIEENCLLTNLKNARIGNYNKNYFAFVKIAESGIDLKKCTLNDLLEFPGIGNKTARFFLLHTRKNEQYAVLDTHILKYLRERGINAPRSTPQGKKKYKELEEIVLGICKLQNLSPLQFDSIVWKDGSGNNG